MNINSWLEDELYQQYLHDHQAVDASWKKVFEQEHPPANRASTRPVAQTSDGMPEPLATPMLESIAEQLVPVRGAAARIAENVGTQAFPCRSPPASGQSRSR